MDLTMQTIVQRVRAQDRILQNKKRSNFKGTLIVLTSDHGMTELGNHGGASMMESSAVMFFIPPENNKNNITKSTSISRRAQVDLVPTLAYLTQSNIPALNTGRIVEEVVALACGQNNSTETTQCVLTSLIDNCRQLYALWETPDFNWEEKEVQAWSITKARDTASRIAAAVTASTVSTYREEYIGLGILLLLVLLGISFRLLKKVGTVLLQCPYLLLHVISLTSSSMIENEPIICFFLYTTFWSMIFVQELKNPDVSKKRMMWIMMILLTSRILRIRNQSINFARLNGLPPIDEDTCVITRESVMDVPLWFYALILISTGLYHMKYSPHSSTTSVAPIQYFLKSVVWTVATVACIFHHFFEQQQEIDLYMLNIAARIVYGAVPLLIVLGRKEYLVLIPWLLTILLQRTSQLSILLFLYLHVVAVVRYYKMAVTKNSTQLAVQWHLLVHVAFFTMGNTHVIGTIDIAKAYTGLTEYHQLLVGTLTFIITFGGVWMTYSSAVPLLTTPKDVHQFCRVQWLLQCVQVVVYSATVFGMRYHLFIWTVFAPKLLYLLTFTVAMACSLLWISMRA